MFRVILGLLLIIGLNGCQALNRPDTGATLQAENAAFGTEAVQLQSNGTAEGAAALQTHTVNTTQIAVLNAVNQQLIATLILQITPTPGLVAQSGPDAVGMQIDGGGGGTGSIDPNTPYTLTGTASRVRADTGCVESPQSSFPSNTQAVYATFVANNLTAGTNLSAEWYREGELVDSAQWTPNENYDQICVWFFMEQATVAFTTGNWSVRLYANDQQIGGTLAFVFQGEPGMMDEIPGS